MLIRALPDDRPDHGPGRFAGRRRKLRRASAGTFPVSGGTFVILLHRHGAVDRRVEFSAGAHARARWSNTS